MATAPEKRSRTLPPIRCTESLEVALMRLAVRDEREFTDYVRKVLERHAFGHAANMGPDFADSQIDRA